MRRLIVTCTCGERIQVPRSALGRTGLYPCCGKTIAITNDNAAAVPLPGRSSSAPLLAADRPAALPDLSDEPSPLADKEEELDQSERDIIKKVLFDKMPHGETDEIQLRAAELALNVFGLDEATPENANEPELHEAGTVHP